MKAKDGRGRLKRRADFLRVGGGRRWHGAAMTVQCGARDSDDASTGPAPRFGFTLTKRVGNAVVRNRARRRLREAVRLAPADLPARDGHDYVVVGRLDAVRMAFDAIRAELARGLEAVHAGGRRSSGSASRPRTPRAGSACAMSDTATSVPPARPAPDRIDRTP